jgi:hypothetical protein
MVDQARRGAPPRDGHVERGQREFVAEVAGMAQPTTRRENRSSTTARYSQPSPVGM